MCRTTRRGRGFLQAPEERAALTLRRVAVRVPHGEAELVATQLLEHFPAGIEELELGARVELAVYTDEAGEAALRDAFPSATSEQVDEGWEDRWKEFHRPVRAGGLWIGPPWIDPPDDVPAVVVDPGRAFGTGAHPTTQACIGLLSTLQRGSLLDAGCGSGVVAVAAALLGFAPVRAIDVDEIAVDVARETARVNNAVVEVAVADVLRDDLPASDVVVANIELRSVEAILRRVSARVLVTAGYYATEMPSAPGWDHIDRLELEGWAADVFQPPDAMRPDRAAQLSAC